MEGHNQISATRGNSLLQLDLVSRCLVFYSSRLSTSIGIYFYMFIPYFCPLELKEAIKCVVSKEIKAIQTEGFGKIMNGNILCVQYIVFLI